MVRSVYEVEMKLNEGLRMRERDRAKCVEWLTSYMLHNNVTVQFLDRMCMSDPDWVFEQVFGRK